jgi:hypothetical protein
MGRVKSVPNSSSFERSGNEDVKNNSVVGGAYNI